MQISLGELLAQIAAAQQRMSRHNPHRELFWRAEQVLVQQAQQLTALSRPRAGEHSMPETAANAQSPPQAV